MTDGYAGPLVPLPRATILCGLSRARQQAPANKRHPQGIVNILTGSLGPTDGQAAQIDLRPHPASEMLSLLADPPDSGDISEVLGMAPKHGLSIILSNI